MANIWRYYLRILEKHPWKTQALLTGVIMGAGDATAQLIVEKKPIDVVRTIKYAGLGVFYVGPGLRAWYTILDRTFGTHGKITVVKKVACDQMLFTPVFLCTLISTINWMQGQSLNVIKLKLEQDYFDTLTANWMIWPAFQLFNFYVIPFQHRVMAVNIVAFFWNTYFAYKANKSVNIDVSYN